MRIAELTFCIFLFGNQAFGKNTPIREASLRNKNTIFLELGKPVTTLHGTIVLTKIERPKTNHPGDRLFYHLNFTPKTAKGAVEAFRFDPHQSGKEIVMPSTKIRLSINSADENTLFLEDDYLLTKEYIVVFKKVVSKESAEDSLKMFRVDFKSGSDSSRGKRYFSMHGPQYRVSFEVKNQEDFLGRIRKLENVFEVYEANDEIQKD